MSNFSVTQDNIFSSNTFENGQASNKMSDKYQAISTSTLAETLKDNGFYVTSSSAVKCNKPENQPYAKHMVRLSHNDYRDQHDGERPEIVITNSHGGQSGLNLMLGVFRFICLNGIITGDSLFSQNIRHSGKNFLDNVLAGVSRGAEKFPEVLNLITELKNVQLTSSQMLDYRQLLKEEIIIPMLTNKNTVKLDIHSNFNPRRQADLSTDLWTCLNRYQEYLIRGGISYTKINDTPKLDIDTNYMLVERKIVNRTTGKVNSIDRKIKLNQKIMDITLKHFNIAA